MTLFGMGTHIGRLRKALATVRVWTLVRLESCVVVQVRLQMVFLGERLWADWTGEGLDSYWRGNGKRSNVGYWIFLKIS